MMGNRLREIFDTGSPDKFRELIQKAHADALERRNGIVLVKDEYNQDPGSPLFRSEPFRGFIGDCDCCRHAIHLPGFVTGCLCGKHNGRGCGFGFTCKDNTYQDNKGWDEFERICKEG